MIVQFMSANNNNNKVSDNDIKILKIWTTSYTIYMKR